MRIKMNYSTVEEIKRRRTFAIISHPDAGKTTITEKLLLYGGAIHQAGSVKARKAARHATSDWMEIEKKRGISVTSSVMQFEYDGCHINILDTPGHQDFSEDTYRTLCAADAAVMVLDGAKGVEAQTIKLFQVCRRRGIPIFTFINKMDRAAKNPFDLMDELEKVLGIRSCPVNWPIGTDGDFEGVYERSSQSVLVFDKENNDHGASMVTEKVSGIDDPALEKMLMPGHLETLRNDIELLDMAGDELDMDKVLHGQLTPVFFGSAITNSTDGIIEPDDTMFSGFVFKIQANMDPAHRDRMAFIRICSGQYEKNMTVNLMRTGKKITLAQPQQFMAQDRAITEEAFAGDIIGIFDPGNFRIGDTIISTNRKFEFDPIPVFSPENFARVEPKDSMKRKQFLKGIEQLSQEGAVQLFKQPDIGTETYVMGVVGILQFDVLEYRLKSEYGVDIVRTSLPYRLARWVKSESEDFDPKSMTLTSTSLLVLDRDEEPVVLFESEWAVDWAVDHNEKYKLSFEYIHGGAS